VVDLDEDGMLSFQLAIIAPQVNFIGYDIATAQTKSWNKWYMWVGTVCIGIRTGSSGRNWQQSTETANIKCVV